MNKYKYIWIATLAWVLVLSSLAFANDIDTSTTDVNKNSNFWGFGQNKKWPKVWNWQNFRSGIFDKYLKTDLTDTEKTALKDIIKAHDDAVKSILESNKSSSWSLSGTWVQNQIKTLRDEFITKLLPYIATDKQESFKTEMAEFPQNPWKWDKNFWKNMNGRESDNFKPNISQSMLPFNINKTLEAKLATFDSNDKKITWLTSINTKIDTLLSKITSQKNKNLLNALKDLINEKIDTLNWNTVDKTIIEDLLK